MEIIYGVDCLDGALAGEETGRSRLWPKLKLKPSPPVLLKPSSDWAVWAVARIGLGLLLALVSKDSCFH